MPISLPMLALLNSYFESLFWTAYRLPESIASSVRLLAMDYGQTYQHKKTFSEITLEEYANFFIIIVIIVLITIITPQKHGRQRKMPIDNLFIFVIDFFFNLFAFIFAPKKRMIFLKSLFAVLAKLTKADGRVGEEEIAAVEMTARKLGLNRQEYAEMVKHFNTILTDDQTSLRSHLDVFAKAFRNDEEARLLFLRCSFALTAADKYLHPKEEVILKNIAATLKISPTLYNILRNEFFPNDRGWRADQRSYDERRQNTDWYRQQSRHQSDLYHNPNRKYYDILGVPPDCDNDELKQAYRKLVLENHPDRLLSKGIPQQALKLANERFVQIQNAYEQIRKIRDIK